MSQYTENTKHDSVDHPLSDIRRLPYVPIQTAFTWLLTPQGYDYWREINDHEHEF